MVPRNYADEPCCRTTPSRGDRISCGSPAPSVTLGVADGRRVMRCVLVGGGVAAAATAAALRRRGFDGEIVLVSDEPDAPYERPPLSKDVLTGGDVVPARKPEWYGDNGVELRLGTRAT